jgi:hypothetical protein
MLLLTGTTGVGYLVVTLHFRCTGVKCCAAVLSDRLGIIKLSLLLPCDSRPRMFHLGQNKSMCPNTRVHSIPCYKSLFNLLFNFHGIVTCNKPAISTEIC